MIGSNIQFAAGQGTVTQTVTVLDDPLLEIDETVVLNVIPGIGYDVGTPESAVVTIKDDELIVNICTAVEVYWNTQTGFTYQVQCTSNLVTGTWTNFGPPVIGDGQEHSTFDSTRHGSPKFYNVLRSPYGAVNLANKSVDSYGSPVADAG